MLVLSRKVDERIIVGDTELVVVAIRADKVRLGVDAPKCMPVWRSEIKPEGVRDPRAVALERIAGIVAAVRRGVDPAEAIDDIEAQVQEVTR